MVVTKQDLHNLIDEIPEQEHQAAAEYLQRLRDLAKDPLYQALMNAPIDDEPLTEEDLAAIEEGRRDVREGRTYRWEEVKADLFQDEGDK